MSEPLYQRLYVAPKSRVAHLVKASASPSSMVSARCGVWPGLMNYWYGTGSWDEGERLKSLPDCIRCERLTSKDAEIRIARKGEGS